MSAVVRSFSGCELVLSDVSGFRPGDVVYALACCGRERGYGRLCLDVDSVDAERSALVCRQTVSCGIPTIAHGDTIEIDWIEMARRERAAADGVLFRARAAELRKERGK
jgi:hypothetical protein